MSRWTHSICEACWNRREPDREPVRIREEFRDEQAEPCCFCGKGHASGISVREDPALVACQGKHEDAA